jgi:hypothetical protein
MSMGEGVRHPFPYIGLKQSSSSLMLFPFDSTPMLPMIYWRKKITYYG